MPVRDAGWIEDFREKFSPWWQAAKPLIADHQYPQAFKDYPWPTFSECPWTPLRKPPARSRIAVVTTAGLYRPGVDEAFDTSALEGDTRYRVLPASVELGRLGIAHAHFPHEPAETDMNTIFPLERLAELARDGVIGELAPSHYSTMGYAVRADELGAVTGPAIAARMRAEQVDAALVVPV